MKSKERVKRAIHFLNPDRFPYNFDSNRTPEDNIRYGEDMIWVFVTQRAIQDAKNEWGVGYVPIGDSFGEPKVFPLEGKESLGSYEFPDFTQEWRYVEMEKVIRNNNGEKYVLGMTPNGIFQHMIDLFGFTEFLTNTLENKELIEAVCDILCESNMKVATKMAGLGVDGIITIDDTALQNSLMISMELFRQIFKPRFKRFYEHCHKLGLDTFIHSCGYTLDIIEELIEVGCDVVNLDQQDNMGIWELSKRYKGRVCFYCPLDIQTTLSMDRDEINDRVEEMVSAFASEDGGFIAKTYPQPRAIGITDEYMKNMTDAFKVHGSI